MDVKVLEQLYEGKAKKVFKTSDENLYMIEYKDDATAFNGEKKGQIHEKGVMNNKISTLIFKKLENNGVKTHLVEYVDDTHQIVHKVEIVMLEVIMRNIVAGSLAKRLGKPEGEKLTSPILELCYKNDELGDPMINDYHAIALGLATKEELDYISEQAFKINDLLQELFAECGLTLVDFKIEFGRLPNGNIILADEISPDTCRLWDSKTNEKLDKDRFRRDLGNVEEAYQEVLSRLEKELND
ncbi:phosphoribosylaminoimidazolesuccinocarboxamide synthase [Actinomyces sp. zg-332]|uniref:phosphoribosylaminoimidazolesuccinocarboxamide synthase n=1 Tax=Actinomyces sp. zg-332 TaxID=2708340 RepID=UPI0022B7CE58|nr:phosphoribosylaminoimidazolesuccinocarboxamide synthase [Actinomyces sp. zg-332]